MEIWLEQGKQKIRLAVLPSEYQLTSESNNTQTVIHSFGEINLLGKRKLKNVSFSSFFPARKYDFCEYSNFDKPKKCVRIIEKMKNKGVLHLKMTGTPVNMDCTIENFTWGENDATKDINFSIEFKEYRKVKLKSKKREKAKKIIEVPMTQRATRILEDKLYEIKKGDDIFKVAKKTTGSSANWKAIFEANKDVLGDNPRKLHIGEKLVIKL